MGNGKEEVEELFSKYAGKGVLNKSKSKKILGRMREWDGRKAVYLVEGNTGSNTHVVVVEKTDNGLEVFCSCLAFSTGKVCSHAILVLRDIAEKDQSLIPYIEKWLESRKEVKADGN
jgi:hypothetical protein